MCDQKSAKKLQAEICWASSPRVSRLTENPNQTSRAKASHHILKLKTFRLLDFFLFRKELEQFLIPFLSLSRPVDRLEMQRAFSLFPRRCLSPEVLPQSCSHGFPVSPLWPVKVHRQPKQQIKLRGGRSTLNPWAAGTGPSVSQLERGVSQ